MGRREESGTGTGAGGATTPGAALTPAQPPTPGSARVDASQQKWVSDPGLANRMCRVPRAVEGREVASVPGTWKLRCRLRGNPWPTVFGVKVKVVRKTK